MSILTPIKEDEKQSKVHHSQYIRSEDKPAEETKPAEESETKTDGANSQAKVTS